MNRDTDAHKNKTVYRIPETNKTGKMSTQISNEDN